MHCSKIVALGSLMAATPLAAQENPFAFTGGAVKTAYIVYDIIGKGKSSAGSSYEIGVTPDRWIMRIVTPFELGGKKDTMRVLSLTTRDSQYTYNTMGQQAGEGEVGPTLRPHLAREYSALDPGSKVRFRQNLKLAIDASGSSDGDQFITLVGEKTGSETILGHKCDVYRTKQATACVLPQAPMVMLRWSSEKEGVNLVARKVTLNGPIPPSAGLLPRGVKWKKKAHDDADFVSNIWALKKQSDPTSVAPATLTQFAVRYLASPQATAELREMGTGTSGDTPENHEPADSEATNEGGT